MSSLDVCATVGCNHRRDEHERRVGECFLCMDCRRFFEPYPHDGHDLIKLSGDPTFCATCGIDVMGPGECATASEPPTVAEREWGTRMIGATLPFMTGTREKMQTSVDNSMGSYELVGRSVSPWELEADRG